MLRLIQPSEEEEEVLQMCRGTLTAQSDTHELVARCLCARYCFRWESSACIHRFAYNSLPLPPVAASPRPRGSNARKKGTLGFYRLAERS